VIRLLIVDDSAETRDHVARLVSYEDDMRVVATAASGDEALQAVDRQAVDVVLLDVNMPGMSGITSAEKLVARAPTAAIIMMSVKGEAGHLRSAMLAGAREFLVKPFSGDELVYAIRQVHQREREMLSRVAALPAGGPSAHPLLRRPGRVVTLFAPKGGVGRTTLAVNIAVAAAGLGRRVALVDASLQFGDVGVLLNLNPRSRSIADLARDYTGDGDGIDGMLVEHSSGVHVVLAPPSPELSELVSAEQLARIVAGLRSAYDLVVIDAPPWLHETTLACFDASELILYVLTLELTSVKNIRSFLGVSGQLGYSDSKVELVLNRADAGYGIRLSEVEDSVGRKVRHSVVSDGRTVVFALNRGVPFVVGNPKAKVSRDIVRLATSLIADQPEMLAPAPRPH
jgi:pilus assembly protein CpaE